MMKLLFYLSLFVVPNQAFNPNTKHLSDQFIQEYNKEYVRPDEYQTRFNIFSSNLDILDRKGKIKANISRVGRHITHNDSAWVIDDTIVQFGKIYKRNGDYRYYTTEAFDVVFFPKDTFPVSLKIRKIENEDNSQDKTVRDAKTIGFTVGSSDTKQKKGSLSSKLAIFDTTMQNYYDFVIGQKVYNGVDCYTFTCQLKDSLSKKDIKKTLIKKLTSYFDKNNFNVLYRDYCFEYRNLLIKLDMKISVSMQYVNGKHVPTEIIYNGFWDLPFFKAERVNFKLILFNYKV